MGRITRWGSTTHARAGRIAALASLIIGTGCYSGVPDVDADVAPETEQGTGGEQPGGSGTDSDPGGPPSEPLCGDLPSVVQRPIRRLTPRQYEKTMRDLLGDPEFEAPYDDAEVIITQDGVRELRAGAEVALENIDRWSADLVPCDLTGNADASCPAQVVDVLAPRAFRRPLSEAERDWLLSIYEDANADGGFRSGMEALVGSILQAPAFIYLIESGAPLESDPSYLALDGHSIASRLSYFLWDTMPDEPLFDAADAGELETPDGIRAQVERMLGDPRAKDKLADVSRDWFHLDGRLEKPGLLDIDKDPDLFGEFGLALAFAMRREFEALVERTLFESGDFGALFTSREAYVNASLAEVYGVQGPASDGEWAWVELDEAQRAGLLTRAGFLATYASSEVPSPIRRGVFVFEDILCNELGEPPPNASDVPVDGGTLDGQAVTVRQEVEHVTKGASCDGCHVIINNIGFPFERYDALGRWQDVELVSGLDIDTSGALFGSDVDGPLADAIDLSEKLARSERVKACFAERWFGEALGAPLEDAESCSLDHAVDGFVQDGNVRDLLGAIATSDAFRFAKINEGGA